MTIRTKLRCFADRSGVSKVAAVSRSRAGRREVHGEGDPVGRWRLRGRRCPGWSRGCLEDEEIGRMARLCTSRSTNARRRELKRSHRSTSPPSFIRRRVTLNRNPRRTRIVLPFSSSTRSSSRYGISCVQSHRASPVRT